MENIKMCVEKWCDLILSIVEFILVLVGVDVFFSFDFGVYIILEILFGVMCCYLLINDGSDLKEFVVVIKRELNLCGGFVLMYEQVIVGFELIVEFLENDFLLIDVQKYLFIVGGIGIMLILLMVWYFDKKGKMFRIIYVSCSLEELVYLDELMRDFDGWIIVYYDGGVLDVVYDFWDDFVMFCVIYVFCCGLKLLMDEIKVVFGYWLEG